LRRSRASRRRSRCPSSPARLTAFEALALSKWITKSSRRSPVRTRWPIPARIHEYGETGNIHKIVGLEFGNVQEGFAQADEIEHFFFKGHPSGHRAAPPWPLKTDRKLTIWSSANTHYLHRALAKVRKCPRRIFA
jgi:hypothetical protein